MENLLINVLLPVYLLIGIGFLMGKVNPQLSTETISHIVVYLFAPMLIFSSFRKVELGLEGVGGIFFRLF